LHHFLTTSGLLRSALHEQDARGGVDQAFQSGIKVLHVYSVGHPDYREIPTKELSAYFTPKQLNN